MRKTSESFFGLAVALLGATAFVLCMIMMYHSLTGSHLIGCSSGSSCDSVLGSSWSMLFGLVPVSALAGGLYLAVALCGLMLKEMKEFFWFLIFASCAILVSSAWFICLMEFRLHAICPYCMATHSVGIVLSLLILIHFFGELRSNPKYASMAIGAGVASAVVLIAVQLCTTPSARFETGRSSEALPQFMAEDEVPIIGNPDADITIELMFDYRCTHCRTMHGWLKELVADRAIASDPSKDVAVILCPTPLSTACNPYLPDVTEDLFKGSCELAKLALALWKTDKELFYRFDDWLYESDGKAKWTPREPEEARKMAVSLLAGSGRTVNLEGSLSDPWIDSYLSMTLELFGRTTNQNSSGIPRLVHGSLWLIPEVSTKEELVGLLRENFNI